MNIVPLIFDRRLFIWLFAGFIIATIAGILSHEGGHYIMARYYGFTDVHMRYSSTGWQCKQAPCTPASERQHIIMMAAGPLQTMVTGTIGFLILLLFSKSYRQAKTLNVVQWIFIFLALFWLRELSNLLREIYRINFTHANSLSGDEFFLSAYLGHSPWFLNIILGACALLVLLVVLFRYIPAQLRFTFMISGLLGGITGAIFWLAFLGPRLMP